MPAGELAVRLGGGGGFEGPGSSSEPSGGVPAICDWAEWRNEPGSFFRAGQVARREGCTAPGTDGSEHNRRVPALGGDGEARLSSFHCGQTVRGAAGRSRVSLDGERSLGGV